jgi:hypothetical protein
MLFHLSFCSRDPERVARALAEILGAQIVKAPSPPFNSESLFVCCGDDRGTMISLEPWGVTYQPGPNQMTTMPRGGATSEHNAFHGLFMARVSKERILAIAAAEGWPAAQVPNGPFEVINVWLESTQLIEFTTPELYPAYRATFDAAGVKGLDAQNRAMETKIRAMMAAGGPPNSPR